MLKYKEKKESRGLKGQERRWGSWGESPLPTSQGTWGSAINSPVRSGAEPQKI